MKMDYTKRYIGKATRWTCFSKNIESQLLSVASKDGLVSIYSQENQLIYECKDERFSFLHLLQTKNYLIGTCRDGFLHIWQVNDGYESVEYRFEKLDLDEGVSISSFLQCKLLESLNQFESSCVVLIGYSRGDIQLAAISDTAICKSNRINFMNCQPQVHQHLDQILEIDYQNHILQLAILVNHQLMFIKCRLEWEINSHKEMVTFKIATEQMVTFQCAEIHIVHMEMYAQDQLIICSKSGKYQILQITHNSSSEMEIIETEVNFPYGPFPCRQIDKCIAAHLQGIKGECYIFSGGMPAATYKHLNSVSVSIYHEPEICFTFDDEVMDFTFIPRGRQGFDEIIVLTISELIFISYQNGLWVSNIQTPSSPFSKDEIASISNIVEIPNQYCSTFLNGYIDRLSESGVIQIFSVAHSDKTVSIWCLSASQYLLIERIDLCNLYNASPISESLRKLLWPRFQKCGSWKNPPSKEIKVDVMKLIADGQGSVFLLISTNGMTIYLWKICSCSQDIDGGIDDEDYRNICPHYRLAINCGIGEEDPYQMKKEDVRVRFYNHVKLVSVISFDVSLDTYSIDYNEEGGVVSFIGAGGFGCVDIFNGKHIFITSSVLELVEKLKSGSNLLKLIQKKMKKRESTDSQAIKMNTEIEVKTRSMFLWRSSAKEYHLILGFNNGSIVIIELMVTDSGEFVVQNKFKTCYTNTKREIINLGILDMKVDSNPSSNFATLEKKTISKDSSGSENKCDPSLNSNASLELKSSGTTNASSNSNDGTSIYSKKSKSSLFQRLSKSNTSPKSKSFLIRFDSQSLKIIDYFKMKTKYKFKIAEFYYDSSEAPVSTLKTTSLLNIPEIIESRITNSDPYANEWKCWLLLTNRDMIELCLPTLSSLRKINISDSPLDGRLMTFDHSSIIIVENQYGCSQLAILSNHQHQTYQLVDIPYMCSKKSSKNFTENDSNQIDFMKEAKISLNSLYWYNV